MSTTIRRRPKTGQVPIQEMPVSWLKPSGENDKLYRPVDPSDPSIVGLARDIEENGVLEPLVITRDGWIISGHRRFAAAKLAGLVNVPCRMLPIERTWNDEDAFVRLLARYNRDQREKSIDERLREELVCADREEAYQSLLDHRQSRPPDLIGEMEIVGEARRSEISAALMPFLQAAMDVLVKRRKFWPLSIRQVHYALLNDPPLKHANKPKSRYDNTLQSYKRLSDLLIRARHAGCIPWGAIHDVTRPVTIWQVHRRPGDFLRDQIGGFLKGYWRDLQQSQPNQIEIIGEKNTVEPIIKPVAMEFCIPLTIGRGFCSASPLRDLATRFKISGKERLVLLVVSDFDPEGMEIPQTIARTLRDEHGIANLSVIKVALTAEQIEERDMPKGGEAKRSSPNYKKFVKEHGTTAYELEALEPTDLQDILRDAIDSVIDVDLFNAELDAEKNDAAYLGAVREKTSKLLADFGGGAPA